MTGLLTDTPSINEQTDMIPVEPAIARAAGFDWSKAAQDLDAQGCAVLPNLLTLEECQAVAGLYPDDRVFRSRVVMGRHGFGRGEYKYFSYPLPGLCSGLEDRALFKAGPGRQPLEPCYGYRGSLSGSA